MKKCFSDIAKSVGFVFGVNLIYVITMILYAKNAMGDTVFLFLLAALYIIALPVYFKIKDFIARPFVYRITTITAQLILCAITYYSLSPLFPYWSGLSLSLTEIFNTIFFLVTVTLDLTIQFFKWLYNLFS